MKKLVLWGAGGLGREVARMVERINAKEPTYELLGFVVDEAYGKAGDKVGDYTILGTEQYILDRKDEVVCTCCLGTCEYRRSVQTRLEAQGVRFETLISPDVSLHHSVKVGAGTLIMDRCILTVDITVGRGVLLNTANTIGHDAVIGDFAVTCGQCAINGYSQLGSDAFMGCAAVLLPHVCIGDGAVVGAGSVAVRNVKAGQTVFGVPAVRLK